MPMRARFLLILLITWAGVGSLRAADTLRIGNRQWQAVVDRETGYLVAYRQQCAGKWMNVPFRTDTLSGIAFKGIALKAVPGHTLTFESRQGDISYRLHYCPASDHLAVEASIANEGKQAFTPHHVRLVLGIDAEMHTYPQWDTKYFPTLLRCEKDFAWGYFMSPLREIVAVGIEEPVASYDINYIYEGIKEWRWGHQIYTASFDLLHRLPLPQRHPQHLTSLKPGERKRWTLHIGGVETLSDVKRSLSAWLKAPLIEADRFVMPAGEPTMVYANSPSGVTQATLYKPDGTKQALTFRPDGQSHLFKASFPAMQQPGAYRLCVANAQGKTAEAQFYVRQPWSWYLKQSREVVAKYPPLFSSSCETFYGYYPAFLAASHFPEGKLDKPLEERLSRTISLVIDTVTGLPQKDALPWRIQNFSSTAGILVDLWEATKNETYLKWASRIGDYICSDSVQWKDGSYRAEKIHYTAVIYPAKSMFELAEAEKKQHALTGDNTWLQRARRHEQSAFRAVDDLRQRLDDIETEGDMTLEDGMVTCSALQLGLGGLTTDNPQLRKQYAEAARYMMDKHECLEQLIIPDARMRGATLRYWEILDIYFSPNQVMSSPHGWTGWKIYAMYYLYQLTGDERYLSSFMDALGAGMQLMDLNGTLHWGFIPDPYIEGLLCTPDAHNPKGWKPGDGVVGEQYMERISPWLRPDDETKMVSFGGKGGAGDHTTFELFKALEECALTSAYVIVTPRREVKTWNCRAQFAPDGTLTVTPAEDIVGKVHINTSLPLRVTVTRQGKSLLTAPAHGLQWLTWKKDK